MNWDFFWGSMWGCISMGLILQIRLWRQRRWFLREVLKAKDDVARLSFSAGHIEGETKIIRELADTISKIRTTA